MLDLINRYRAYLEAERNASRYTVRNYMADLFELVDFLKGQNIESFDQVTKQDIRNYVSDVMGRGIVKRSIARKISAIRSFYRFLLRENLISKTQIPLSISGKRGTRSDSFSLKLDKRLPKFLNRDETINLVEAPALTKTIGLRDRALLEVMYASGMRVSELAGLNLEQLNLNSREILVRGKGSKERITLIGEPAAAALVDYIAKARLALLKHKTGSALFLNHAGGRLTVRSIQRIIGAYARTAGIDCRVHPHMMRHSCATHMLDGGADLRVVQELLGHVDVSSTEVYTHVSRAQARRAYLAAHPLAQKQANGL